MADSSQLIILLILATAKKNDATLWAKIAQSVKKPPRTVNVIDFDFFGFNASIWVSWSPLGPKKS